MREEMIVEAGKIPSSAVEWETFDALYSHISAWRYLGTREERRIEGRAVLLRCVIHCLYFVSLRSR